MRTSGEGWTLENGTLHVTGYVRNEMFTGVRRIAIADGAFLLNSTILVPGEADLQRMGRWVRREFRRQRVRVNACNFQVQRRREQDRTA